MKLSKNSKRWLVLSLLVTVLGALLYFLPIFPTILDQFKPNYAQEAARPLETALIQKGAVKICDSGSNGRYPSNDQPWYSASYQLPVGKERAIQIVNQVSSENGYMLSHSDSPYESIEFYSDETSKSSPYKELEVGKVKINFSTYSDTAKQKLTCPNNKALEGNANSTAVSLGVSLPNFKH